MAVDERDRHSSRERALGLLYEAHAKHLSIDEVVDALPLAPDPFCLDLLGAVTRNRAAAEALVADAAVGWSFDRRAVIDRLICTLAACELLDRAEPPVAVVLDEAIELAKTYSTDDSGRFVNGLLVTVAKKARPAA